MKIRVKIFLVILPVVIVTLILVQTASYFHSVNGINRIAQQFFKFKTDELKKYAENQWALLVENNYAGRDDMVGAARNAVELYARSILLSDTEIIFAVNEKGESAMSTSPLEMSAEERERLLSLLREEDEGMVSAVLGGKERVFRAFYFTPFGWYVAVSEESSAFFSDAEKIRFQIVVTVITASLVVALILIFFTRYLTKPISRVVESMNTIIASSNLSGRVDVEYNDETGILAGTFNVMISELEKLYKQIKRYAFDAVLAGKKEQRIRQIFQKYVPKDLIDKFFAAPEAMLVGDNRDITILFSDIRRFTTISESMAPDDLVHSLNRYFSGQVDIVMNRNGIVDKYIGDAIMAFWGAPVKHADDALQSVLSGLDMIDALKDFNEHQRKIGKPEFHIGIGISYGVVTVGNIGSERKMEYTVIGDAVNLASRMEGLTKNYHEEILISEFLYREIEKHAHGLPVRLLDTVAVKGRTGGVKIYTVKRSLPPDAEKAWSLHNEGMELYYRRSFQEASAKFQRALELLPDDFNAANMLARCAIYAADPPPENWDGVKVMNTK
jgi:class 3 adenylate cyclase/HAMP domain-containing protein